MTPADIAKVREALDPERGCSTCRGSGIRPGATKLFPSPGEPSPTCLDCGGNGRCSRVRKALSILDAEAMVAPVQPSITGTLNGTTFTELQHAVDAVEAMVAPGREPTAAELHSAAIKKAFEELGPVNQTVSPGNDAPPSITYLTQEQLAKMDCPYPPEPGYEDETPRAGAPIMTLKPCPFCGGEAEVKRIEASGGLPTSFWAECVDGCVDTDMSAWEEKVVRFWNHRPGEEAVAEECARIAEMTVLGMVPTVYVDQVTGHIAKSIRSRFGGKA